MAVSSVLLWYTHFWQTSDCHLCQCSSALYLPLSPPSWLSQCPLDHSCLCPLQSVVSDVGGGLGLLCRLSFSSGPMALEETLCHLCTFCLGSNLEVFSRFLSGMVLSTCLYSPLNISPTFSLFPTPHFPLLPFLLYPPSSLSPFSFLQISPHNLVVPGIYKGPGHTKINRMNSASQVCTFLVPWCLSLPTVVGRVQSPPPHILKSLPLSLHTVNVCL